MKISREYIVLWYNVETKQDEYVKVVIAGRYETCFRLGKDNIYHEMSNEQFMECYNRTINDFE